MSKSDRDAARWFWKEHSRTHYGWQSKDCEVCQNRKTMSTHDFAEYVFHTYLGPARMSRVPKKSAYDRSVPRNAIQRARDGVRDWDDAPEHRTRRAPFYAFD